MAGEGASRNEATSNGGSSSSGAKSDSHAPLTAKGAFDAHLYGDTPLHTYVHEIQDEVQTPMMQTGAGEDGSGLLSSSNAASRFPQRLIEAERRAVLDAGPGRGGQASEAAYFEDKSLAAREDAYKKQRFMRALSPERDDPFSAMAAGKSRAKAREQVVGRSYADVMAEQQLDREKQAAVRQVRKMQEEQQLHQQLLLQQQQQEAQQQPHQALGAGAAGQTRRPRFAASAEADGVAVSGARRERGPAEEGADGAGAGVAGGSRWETPLRADGDGAAGDAAWTSTPSGPATPGVSSAAEASKPKKRSRWDATPEVGGGMGQVRKRKPTRLTPPSQEIAPRDLDAQPAE